MARKKYYAYFLPSGKKQGVTDSWSVCEKIVSGKPDARYRGFKTREEAESWLKAGARYEHRIMTKLDKGIYFDAGTGRGEGVEISVTDEKGKNLLHKTLSRADLNKFGKHLVQDKNATNNYGELLAFKYALKIAAKERVKKIFGDSMLVIDYWSKWHVKKDVAEETFELAREVSKLRADFEKKRGRIARISGDDNPADLGFHR